MASAEPVDINSVCGLHSPLQLCWDLSVKLQIFWYFTDRLSERHCKFFSLLIPIARNACVHKGFFLPDLLPDESSAIWLCLPFFHQIFDPLCKTNSNTTSLLALLPCFHFTRCLYLQLFPVVDFSTFTCWVTLGFLLNLSDCSSHE